MTNMNPVPTSTMDTWLPVITGQVRGILMASGTTLVANGTFTTEQWQQVVGVLMMVGTLVWSAIQNRAARRHVIAMAAEAGTAPPKAAI